MRTINLVLFFKISKFIYKLYFKCFIVTLVADLLKNTLIRDGELTDLLIGLPIIISFFIMSYWNYN